MAQHTPDEERSVVCAALRMLGSLFRNKPSEPSLVHFYTLVQSQGLASNWPFGEEGVLQQIETNLRAPVDAYDLDMEWQRLFIGPNHLQAPPWGSVYLDKENLVFGDSTMALASFLHHIGMDVNTGMNEPPDHIGLMFWYMSGLLDAKQDAQLVVLLGEHTLPWAYRYLDLLFTHTEILYFKGLSQLAQITLGALEQSLRVTPEKKYLFF